MAGLDPRYEGHQNWFGPIKYKSILNSISPMVCESVTHEKSLSAVSESLSFAQTIGEKDLFSRSFKSVPTPDRFSC
jgi:hypothetical protein